jgi:hypothetical protein
MGDPRNYSRSGVNQAMPEFFFAARCDGAFRAIPLNPTYLQICASRQDGSQKRTASVNKDGTKEEADLQPDDD